MATEYGERGKNAGGGNTLKCAYRPDLRINDVSRPVKIRVS